MSSSKTVSKSTSNDVNDNKMDEIIHIDTEALLSALKTIEYQLSEYKRQDILPKWASTLLPRLETLEKGHIKSNHTRKDVSLKQMYADDKLIEKIRGEVETKANTLKANFESKTAATALEVDRLHKLLYIRPTTTELQQVLTDIQNVHIKTDAVVGNATSDIHVVVSQKLAEEMSSIVDRLKVTEEHCDKTAVVVDTRVSNMENEIRNIRSGIKSDFDQTVVTMGDMKETTSAIIGDVASLNEHLTDLEKDTKEAIQELTTEHDLVVKDFAEFEGATNERLEILEENLTACDDLLREEISRSDERHDVITSNIQEITDTFETFKDTYATELESMRGNHDAIQQLLNTTIERQNSILSYVESLQEFDLTAKVSRNEEGVETLRHESELLEETVNGVLMQVMDVKKEQTAMNEELQDVPTKINVEAVKIEVNNKEIKSLKDSLKYTKTMIQEQQNQLEDLSVLKEHMVMVKDVCDSQDDRIKKILRNVAEVVENGEIQEKRIDEVVSVISATEEKLMNRITASKNNIEDSMTLKATETASKVHELKESIETIAANVGSRSKPGASKNAIPLRPQKGETDKKEVQVVDAYDQRPGSADASIHSVAADRIETIADMCMNFEQIACFRNMVPRDMPSALCGDLASVAQNLAAVLAETADMEVIQKIIRGDPADIGYEDPVIDKRQSLVNNVMIGLRDKLNQLAPTAGAVRLEARDMFVTRFYHALQLAMSKHDQILATGGSRLGRLKVPVCIACDRPLVNKPNVNQVQRDSISTIEREKSPSLSMRQHSSVYSEGHSAQSKGLAPIGQLPGECGEGSLYETSMDEDSNLYPGSTRRRNESVRAAGANLHGVNEAKRMSKTYSSGYVLRAGFRMPKNEPRHPAPLSSEGKAQQPLTHPI